MATREAIRNHPDAEKSLIGAVLLRPDVFDLVELEADEFFDPRHREIWRAVGRLRAQGAGVDPRTLDVELERVGQSAAVGGVAVLAECLNLVPTADNAAHYARVVRDDALTRRIHAEIAAVAGSGLEAEELLGRLHEAVTGLGVRRAEGAISMADLAAEAFLELGELAERKARGESLHQGVATGIGELDWQLGGGLQLGVVTILGGRPSHGKSSLARTLADNASAAGFAAHVFSLEDDRRAYVLRALSDHAGVNLQRLRAIDLRSGEMARLAGAAEALRRRNWLLDDAAGLTSAQVAMRVRRHKLERGTKLVVVDYLQLMREPGCKDRRAELEQAVRGLAELARREGVAVLALSQLSRANVKEEREPRLHDLRESGELEQVASVVLLVHQEQARDNEGEPTGPRQGKVIVAKNKHGARDVEVPLHWDATTATYRDKGVHGSGDRGGR